MLAHTELTRAAVAIRTYGWCRHIPQDSHGRLCITGACGLVLFNRPSMGPSRTAHKFLWCVTGSWPTNFNDYVCQNEEEAAGVLLKAAALAKKAGV